MRWNKHGHDVSDRPSEWSAEDVEVCQTNFRHPSITSGQHTNGPATVWLRHDGGDWFSTGETHLHKVRMKFLSRPMTPEEADAAYESAPDDPISEDEIEDIVRNVLKAGGNHDV